MSTLLDVYNEKRTNVRGNGGNAKRVEISIINKLTNLGFHAEHEIFNELIDPLHKIDITINNEIFVHVQRDLWMGTAQQDRLKSAIKCTNTNILYFVFSDNLNWFLAQKSKQSSTKYRIQQALKNLVYNNKILTEETFYEFIITKYK